MSEAPEESDKSFEPTPQKLLEARRKGEVAKSTDLMVAAGYLGLFAALLLAGSASLARTGEALTVLIDRADELAALFLAPAIAPPMGALLASLALGLAPLFLLPAALVLAAILAQRALVFAPEKLKPQLSRLSLLRNARNKFGRDGLFEFAKSFAKLLIYSLLLALFIGSRLEEMIAVLRAGPRPVLALLAELCLIFLFILVLIAGAIGLVDAVWQHFAHLRKNRMSHKEIRDETKNAEGDPHLKQARRQRAVEISRQQMMGAVAEADVVIVNPTHYAVALRWSRAPGAAPACVAKGVDEVALAIRRRAEAAGVPVHSDPPTARALHATVELGQEIGPTLYPAVAAAIRFAEEMRRRARRGV